MSLILDVRNLRVELPTPRGMLQAVRGIDLQVNRGEMLCLVGESGCGKSMTSLALMGLLPAKARRSADRLAFCGEDLLTMNERQLNGIRGARMSMIFQEPMTSLNPSFTLATSCARPCWPTARPAGPRPASARSTCSSAQACRRPRIACASIPTNCRAACASG